MVREIISISVGQGGIQLGETVWNQYRAEHGIDNEGKMSKKASKKQQDDYFTTFFEETSMDMCVPRNIYVDLEPTVVDEVRKGPCNKLFHSDFLISGKEDAANNFARGHYTVGKEMLDSVNDKM